jgi:hypothetical protein
MKSRHKRIMFANSKELGKHRRFKHHVVGARNEIRLRYLANKKAKEAAAARTPPPTTGPLMCPECEAQGIVTVYKNTKALGVHRHFKHKVLGKNHEINQRSKARQAAARGESYTPRPLPGGQTQLAVLTPKETDIASSSTESNHHANAIPTEAYAVIVGSILKEIRTYADTHGFVARDFTAGVIGYLRGSSLR